VAPTKEKHKISAIDRLKNYILVAQPDSLLLISLLTFLLKSRRFPGKRTLAASVANFLGSCHLNRAFAMMEDQKISSGPRNDKMSCAAPNQMHWEDLRARSREEIVNRPGVEISDDHSSYEVGFLNAMYLVDPVRERILELWPDPSRELSEEFQILLIRYLVARNAGPVDGKDVSEKDFPGGVTFFQGPHTLHTAPIAERFGSDPDAFEVRCREFGAVPAPHGDRAMRFLPFPMIPVTYVLWRTDEEFPASVSVLFDSSIARWFEFDMIFTLVRVLTERIVKG